VRPNDLDDIISLQRRLYDTPFDFYILFLKKFRLAVFTRRPGLDRCIVQNNGPSTYCSCEHAATQTRSVRSGVLQAILFIHTHTREQV